MHPMADRRLRHVATAVAGYVRRAPGTHVYLLVLLVTTATVRSLDPALATQLLRRLSTNLTQMGQSAGRVLFLSAFLLDGSRWIVVALSFTVVYVPLERWVGTWRWLLIVTAGHVGATLVTTVGIWADVRSNRGGLALSSTIDVGVSYGVAAAVGFLTFAFTRHWIRGVYGAVVATYLGYEIVRFHTFTAAGHTAAGVIGASMYLLLGPAVTHRPRWTLPATMSMSSSSGPAPDMTR